MENDNAIIILNNIYPSPVRADLRVCPKMRICPDYNTGEHMGSPLQIQSDNSPATAVRADLRVCPEMRVRPDNNINPTFPVRADLRVCPQMRICPDYNTGEHMGSPLQIKSDNSPATAVRANLQVRPDNNINSPATAVRANLRVRPQITVCPQMRVRPQINQTIKKFNR